MKIISAHLKGTALDWAVAHAVGRLNFYWPGPFPHTREERPFQPSTNWQHAGPLIDEKRIALWPDEEGGWFASEGDGEGADYHGDTALEAAMRCYVICTIGRWVDVPEGVPNT